MDYPIAFPVFCLYNRAMDFEKKNFFWGMLLGAAVAALAGALALSRSFRTSPLVGGATTNPRRKGPGRQPAAKKPAARR